MRMNIAILVLATSTVSPALCAPTHYWYRNLLVEFEGRAFLISGIALGTEGYIPIPILPSMSFAVSNSLVSEFVSKFPLSVAVTSTDATEDSEHDSDDSGTANAKPAASKDA
jgi:hypothetical protein